MKILKRILTVLLIFIVLLIIASLFTPKSLQVEEEVIIDAPASMVFDEISDFRNWKNWSQWHQMDTNMKNVYSDTMAVVGAFNSWTSDHPKVGDGKQTVVEIEKDKLFKTKMEFGGIDNNDFSSWKLEPLSDNQTKVIWTFEGSEMPFYYRLMSALFLKGMIRDSYQYSLNELKKVVEAKPITIELPQDLKIIDVEAEMSLNILDSTTADDLSNKLAELYRDIMIFATVNNMTQSGPPMAYYHSYSDDKVVLEAAIPVEGNLKEEGRIFLKEKKAGKAISAEFYGNYENTASIHEKIGAYLEASKTQMSDSPYEIYITDPGIETDTSKWRTDIVYPIQ